jgi:polyisoprenoid-binding protein YceI
MEKKLLVIIFIFLSTFELHAQRYMSDSTFVKFFSEAMLENIAAYSTETTSAIDIETGRFAFNLPIKSFQFKKSLMQEHFNENYLESDKYPKATFLGTIRDWKKQEGKVNVTATGEMTIHGVTRNIDVKGDISFDGNKIIINSVFPIRLEDYNIKIPKAVFYNIAEEVEVTVYFDYSPL